MTKKKVPVSRIFCLILAVLFFLAGIYLLLAAIAGNGTPVAKISDFLLEKGILRTFGYSATVLTVAGCVALALSLLSLFLSHHPVLLSLLLATLSVGLGVYGFFYLKHFSPRLFVILVADGVIIFLCALLMPKEEPLQLRKKSAPAQTGSPETAEPAVAESESAVTEPAVAEPAVTEPAVAEPVVAETAAETEAAVEVSAAIEAAAGEAAEEAAMAAEPLTEPAVAEPVSEMTAEVSADADHGRVRVGEKEIEVSYRKSFTARLLLSEDPVKDFYVRIHNYILSYTGKNRVSWFYDSYNSGRTQLVKLAIRGKTLCAYFALDFAEYENTKYHVQEAATKRYEKVPVMLRVRSERGVRYAKELVDAVMAKYGVAQNEKKTGTATAADYPVDTLQNLISRQLVKVLATDGDDLTGEDVTLVPVAFTVRHSVTVHEAKNLLSDEDALTLVAPAAPEETAETEKELPYHGGRKFPVNIDTLSAHFENGDTVTPAALRRMGLIPKKAAGVKILARGTLNKSLTVLAHDFSADAVKMIALTGGQIHKL